MKYPSTEKYDANGGFAPPVTPGDYVVKLSKISETDKDGKYFTFKDGTKYLRFDFVVKGYPNMFFDRFVLDENYEYSNIMLGRFKQMQIAMGVDTTTEGDTDILIDKICKVSITNKEYQGKVYNNIQEYMLLTEPVSDTEFDEDLPF